MLLKCMNAPVKVDLRYTLISNSPSRMDTSTSRNYSEVPGVSSYVKRRFKCGLLSTFSSSRVSLRDPMLKQYDSCFKC